LSRKPRIQVEEKTATELVQAEERREKLAKHHLPVRSQAHNLFPFSPAREGRPNPMGLTLDKHDCRILRGVQEHGFKPIREFCKLIRVPERIFYTRFRVNPDLSEAMKLLAFTNLALGFPGAMSTLSEKFSENAAYAKLYLQVVGLLGDDESPLKIVKPKGAHGSPLLTEEQIDAMMTQGE